MKERLMMKYNYTNPIVDIMILCREDVISTSLGESNEGSGIVVSWNKKDEE